MEESADETNSTETDEVDVREYGKQEAKEEERHKRLCIHHVDDHRITYNHDESAGYLQAACDDFRNGGQHCIDRIRTSYESDKSCRNCNTDALKKKTADMAHFNAEGIALCSEFIARCWKKTVIVRTKIVRT